jgi:hypothetical protein
VTAWAISHGTCAGGQRVCRSCAWCVASLGVASAEARDGGQQLGISASTGNG